jgi:hypothetical protein
MAGFIMATTTNYSWSTPDNTAYVKDGASAIRTLGSAVDTSMFAALSGKPAQGVLLNTTAVSAATTVVFSSVFSADYDIYLLTYNGKAATSGSGFLRLTFGAANTGYYFNLFDGRSGSGSVAVQLQASNSTSLSFSPNWDLGSSCQTWISNPFKTLATTVSSQFAAMDSAPVSTSGNAGGALNNTTSYTACTVTPSTSTMTGTFRLYGLRNS